MLKLSLLTALAFGGAMLGTGVVIAVLADAVGHNGTGAVLALGGELVLFGGGALASFRWARASQAVKPWVWVPLALYGTGFALLAVPLFIATLLAFDH